MTSGRYKGIYFYYPCISLYLTLNDKKINNTQIFKFLVITNSFTPNVYTISILNAYDCIIQKYITCSFNDAMILVKKQF